MPFETAVRFRFDDFGGFITEYSGNISLGGMFVRTDSPPPVGSTIDVEFKLDDDFDLIRGRGKVIWVRDEAESPERPAGMGVRFLALTPGSRELIFQVVDRYVRQGGIPFDIEIEAAEAAQRGAKPAPPPAPLRPRAVEPPAEPRLAPARPRPAVVAERPSPSPAVPPAARPIAEPPPVAPPTREAPVKPAAPAAPAGRISQEPPAAARQRRETAAEARPTAANAPAAVAAKPSKKLVEPRRRPPPTPAESPAATREGRAATEDDGAGRVLPSVDDLFAAPSPSADVGTPWAAAMPPPVAAIPPPVAAIPPAAAAASPRAAWEVAGSAARRRPAWRPVAAAAAGLILVASLVLAFQFRDRLAAWVKAAPASADAVRPAPEPPPSAVPPLQAKAAEAVAAEATGDAAGPEPTPPVAAADAAPAGPPPTAVATTARPGPSTATAAAGQLATRIERITWQDGGGATELVVWGDGSLAGAYRHLRLAAAPPRELIRLQGIAEPFAGGDLRVDNAQLLRIRTGHHPELRPPELHLVLDLTGAGVKITGVADEGSRLRIRIEGR